MADLAVVVVTYNALPYIEQCLQSVEGWQTVVVDHGSKDGTVALVEERFPDVRVLRQENLGLAAGWNRGIRETTGEYVLILNADAWAVGDGVRRLLGFAEDAARRPRVVGPKLLNTDGSLQRSVRGFPTLWRLATEYFFLRKLAPDSQALNGFYAGGFEHDQVREAEFVMGAVMLVRRAAIEAVGPLDEDFFLFSEETDWCYRFRAGGLEGALLPGRGVRARGRRGPRRALVHGEPARPPPVHGEAPRARRGRARAPAAARGPAAARHGFPRRARPDVPRRGRLARLRLGADAAGRAPRVSRRLHFDRLPRELAAVAALLATRWLPDSGLWLYLKLAAATLVVLLPGSLVARLLGRASVSATVAWTLAAIFGAGAITFAVHGSLDLALGLYALLGAGALAVLLARPAVAERRRPVVVVALGRRLRAPALARGRRGSEETRSSTSRAFASCSPSATCT